MNRTIISIEVQDNGGKEANIIVRGKPRGRVFWAIFRPEYKWRKVMRYSFWWGK